MATKRGKKRNKQTVAADRARYKKQQEEIAAAKSGKKKRDAKEIAVIIISVIVACSLMLPSLAQIFAQPQSQTIPTTPEEYEERYQPLVEQYQADLNADPEDAEAELNLANTYFEWGTYARMFGGNDELTEQANTALTNAYDAYGKFVDMQGNLETTDAQAAKSSQALCDFYLGNTPGAIDMLDDLTKQTNYAPAWANLGMIYASEGNKEAALEAYQKGIEADPDDANGTKSYCEQQIESLNSEDEAAETSNASGDGESAENAEGTDTSQDTTAETTQEGGATADTTTDSTSTEDSSS